MMETDATGERKVRSPAFPSQSPGSRGVRLTRVNTLWRHGVVPTAPAWLRFVATALVLCGAALVATTAAIHLHLWLAGYRHIRWIGPLFLIQSLTGFVLALTIASFRRLLIVGTGALFMAGSIGALTLSATVGFLGLHDGLDVPWALRSLIVEIIGFVFLATACLVPMVAAHRGGLRESQAG